MKIEEFHAFQIKDDPYYDDKPLLKLDDLCPRYEGEIKLSYMMSTYNRGAQLSRTLETLCRQSFKQFEVLLNDDGSTQDIKAIVDMFFPYLNIRYFYTPREHWISCSSKAYKKMLPECQGEVIAIAHPEMMLHKDAMFYLYYAADEKIYFDNVVYSHLNDYNFPRPQKDDWVWVTLKPLFIDKRLYPGMDLEDWHEDVDNLRELPGFKNAGGLSNQPNSFHLLRIRCPWWFVASAKREAPIWNDMPVFEGHAKLDMWLITYRHHKKYVDCTPINFLCYHQVHATSAVGPDGESDTFEIT